MVGTWRLVILVGLTVALGIAYAAADIATAIPLLAGGGFVAGMVAQSPKAALVPLVAAVGTTAVLILGSSDNEGPVNLSVPVTLLIAAGFGVSGVPTAALGAMCGRRVAAGIDG